MDRTEYDQKCLDMLSTPTYATKPIDPSPHYEKKISQVYLNLKKANKLSEQEYRTIIPRYSSTPIFYGLPKVHKKDIPLRPIVDFQRSPSFKLATYLNTILKTISKKKYAIKNSYEFVDRISTVKVKPGYILVSFDVTSLYTNVPQQHTLNYIKKRLKEETKWKQITNLEEEDILQLLMLCLECSYFSFRNIIYYQKDGVPMGSPVSPIFADLFMESLGDEIVPSTPFISYWNRYVDDIFAIIKGRKCNDILNKLNNINASVNFTMEIENDGKLAFLDVDLSRNPDNTLSRKVYRKSTHTNRYLHFSSYHHISHKISVADALLYRAFKICDVQSIEEEPNHITKMLRNNGYPASLIQKRQTKMKEKLLNFQQNLNQLNDPPSRFVLPYLGPVTSRLTDFLRRKTNFEFGYTPGIKIRTLLSSHKDKKPKRSFGIYRIPCHGCPDQYIGETKRTLDIRVKEHKRDLRKMTETSSFVQHVTDNPNHRINFDDAKIIHFEARYFARKFKEGLYINAKQRAMNQNDGMHLNPIWTPTLLPLL
ncbi:uncharacterized protein LOC110856047 [Folsomia candida]|uniref:uncharacterized protein LOC110856047 n=1 Tax=Folsomia candida TaxID=158441 RepID=UPI000B8FE86A|nr:uncharacterized protein LOC110856047 [Folsomia candida]